MTAHNPLLQSAWNKIDELERELSALRADKLQEVGLLEAEILTLRQARAKPVAWLLLDTAPMYACGRDALIGEYAQECGWKKVTIWEPTWTRDDCIARGATHWWPHLRDLPAPTAAQPAPAHPEMERVYKAAMRWYKQGRSETECQDDMALDRACARAAQELKA